MTPLLELAAPCALVASGPSEEGWEAEIRVGPGCREAVVVAPPGLAVLGVQSRARLSDDTRRAMGRERQVPTPRDAGGTQRTRVLFPDLLSGDRVFLTVTSTSYAHVPATPAGAADVVRSIRLAVPEGADPLVALIPGNGASWTWEDTWTLAPSEGDRAVFVAAPPGATLTARVGEPGASGSAVSLTGAAGREDGAWLRAGPGPAVSFAVVTRGVDPALCGPVAGPPGAALRDFQVAADGATIVVEGGWWRVTAWDGSPIYDEPARTVAILDARYRSVSLPEPGLPMRVRGRLDGWSLAGELAPTLRQRASVAPTSTDPLWPRPLNRARRSGITSPVEAALIVRAYALQGRFEADWALVRPLGLGPAHPACPEGRPEALVRVFLRGEPRWVDPGCAACGAFEVRPELLGAPALGPWITETPEPPRGGLVVSVAGAAVDVALEGPAALELRSAVQSLPPEARGPAIAARFAGEGAVLAEISGFTEPGAPIKLRAIAADPARVPSPEQVFLPAPLDDGGLWFPWLGPRAWATHHDGGERVERWSMDPSARRLSAPQATELRASLRPEVLTTP